MGRASSAKKISRAAKAGGRSPGGGGRSLAWPLSLGAVVVVGLGLVVVSSAGRDSTASEAPRLSDHWHEAYGVYVCDSYLPAFPDNMASTGLHTHQDGLAHVEPRSTAETGANATLARFAEGVSLEVSQEAIVLPDGSRYEDGDECDGEPATVRLLRNGEPTTAAPEDIRLTNGGSFAFVFAPEDAEVPPVPSVGQLGAVGAAEPPRSTGTSSTSAG